MGSVGAPLAGRRRSAATTPNQKRMIVRKPMVTDLMVPGSWPAVESQLSRARARQGCFEVHGWRTCWPARCGLSTSSGFPPHAGKSTRRPEPRIRRFCRFIQTERRFCAQESDLNITLVLVSSHSTVSVSGKASIRAAVWSEGWGMNPQPEWRKHRTTNESADLLASYHQSGLTQREFAARQGVSLSCLSIWLRKASLEGRNPVPTAFVQWPVDLKVGGDARPTYKIGFRGGYSVEVSRCRRGFSSVSCGNSANSCVDYDSPWTRDEGLFGPRRDGSSQGV